MAFINDNFMISSVTGRRLYSRVARDMPVIDYHCHLVARDIYENQQFSDITALWLAGDHYKWRAMRANGIPEREITGDASAEEKFEAWAHTVEACPGNPLYHWTHLELNTYFQIAGPLSSKNWREVMDACNSQLQQDTFRPRELIERSGVEILCTTDSPLDDLRYHRLLQHDTSFKPRVLPTFRPDELFEPDEGLFCDFVLRLEQTAKQEINDLQHFQSALESRIVWFHNHGCRISDHGLQALHFKPVTEDYFATLMAKRLTRTPLTEHEQVCWDSAILVMLAGLYKKYDWAMQIHFGALRNNHSRHHKNIGINCGFDSIVDQTGLAVSLNGLLDAIDQNSGLPRVILYNLNAAYNDVVASAAANFQSGEDGVRSPVQFGAGWWLNDTKRGMLNQLNTLADQGLLSNFIGMLTDSRSFISYPRHDYFRRILCNLIGQWVDDNELPDDPELTEGMIRNICADNARRYFDF
ncbi:MULTISPECIES: glucuronate isomerase [unclassified Raoultella]|uniref:glucuronate isomerase n=1 Tax=unclassified Raoultella TaxID=2627600 RepID=UPI0013583F93|nr:MULTISPECIES: glucuronate isomerase [unclassified Raoultella]